MGVQLIHIGKCGGSTVASLLDKHNIRARHIHIKKPVFNPRDKYLIVIRNPIDRFISAFNWRYKLVVLDETQKNRFPRERDTLTKYATVNNLAENIAAFDVNKTYIHHIREDIHFYLGDLLKQCKKEQIVGVITQENLNHDMEQILNIQDNSNIYINKNSTKTDKYLSELGYEKIKQYLHKDYECIQTLFDMGCLTQTQYEALSK